MGISLGLNLSLTGNHNRGGGFGPELILNGSAFTDTSNWTSGAGATLAAVTGELKVTNDGTGSSQGYAYQSFPTVIGRTYQMGADNTSAGQTKVRVGTSAGSSADLVTSNILGGTTVSEPFVASATTTFISLMNNTTAAGANRTWDNITVREVL